MFIQPSRLIKDGDILSRDDIL